MHRRVAVVLCLVAGLSATSCAGSPSTSDTGGGPALSPTPSGDPLSMVVLGDSIPFNLPQDCPGCDGFVDTFADAAVAELGVPIAVTNLSRHDGAQTHHIADQLEADDAALAALGDAEIVLLSFGFNDQPPYWSSGPPCQNVSESDDEATFVAALAATTTECIDARTSSTAAVGSGILNRVRELSPDGAIGVLNSYNSWIGWPVIVDSYPDSMAAVTAASAYALDAWHSALCAAAETIDAICVDIYHAFNGADGLRPAGDLLAADYTHPSQTGNDAIRDVLLQSDILSRFTE